MKRLVFKAGVALLIIIANIEIAFSESLSQLGSLKRGAVKDFSVVTLKAEQSGFHALSNQFVIAMRDSEDKLRLMVVEVSNSGQPQVVANVATDGTIKGVSVARVSPSRVVTAVRDSEDKLRLIAFDILNNGRTIARLGTAVSKKIREVDIAGEDDSATVLTDRRRVFSVANDSNGRLFVADWKVKENGSIKLLDSKVYNGEARLLNVENGLTGSYFMSATMQDSEDLLRLIAFQSPNQTTIQRGGLGGGGKVREVRSSGYSFSSDLYTASISEGPIGVHGGLTPIDRRIVDAGFLKIIRWGHQSNDNSSTLINTSANAFERKRERELIGPGRSNAKYEGMAETAAIMNLDGGGGVGAEVVTAHAGFGTFKKLRTRDQGKPRLRVIAWDKNLSAKSKSHIGGRYSQVELTALNPNPVSFARRFVTVLRGEGDELKIVVWGLN